MNDGPLGEVRKTGKKPPTNMEIHLTPAAQREFKDRYDNEKEAYALLDLINAEFQSDPTSTQCFDLRIVARVKVCVETVERLKKGHMGLLMP
jgi:hypothetical protein